MDGKKVMDVGQAKAIIPIKKGTHSIVVYPINSEKIEQNIISGKINGIGTFEVDLSALGIGKNELTFGKASDHPGHDAVLSHTHTLRAAEAALQTILDLVAVCLCVLTPFQAHLP